MTLVAADWVILGIVGISTLISIRRGFVKEALSLVTLIAAMAGLGGLDRTLGMVFGFARGVLILVVVVAVAARLGFSESSWWQESLFIPEFVAISDWLQAFGLDGANRLLEQAAFNNGTET